MSASSSITNFDKNGSEDHRTHARAFVLATLATIFVLLSISALVRFTLMAPIAPRLSGNASFDQKLMFIKAAGITDQPISLFSGSSMALNNLDTDEIESDSGIRALNLGAWSMSVAQSAAFASLFVHQWKVNEITLSAQFFEMVDGEIEALPASEKDIIDYLSDDFWLTLKRPLDILDSASTWMEWRSTYTNPGNSEFLSFTRTGAALLSITKKTADPARWNGGEFYSETCLHCMDSLSGMCSFSRLKGIAFTLFMPPFREVLHTNPRYDEMSRDRRARAAQIIDTCGGRMFDADAYAEFDDSCFSDWAHLNKAGARAVTQLFIDWKRGRAQAGRQRIVCGEPF